MPPPACAFESAMSSVVRTVEPRSTLVDKMEDPLGENKDKEEMVDVDERLERVEQTIVDSIADEDLVGKIKTGDTASEESNFSEPLSDEQTEPAPARPN